MRRPGSIVLLLLLAPTIAELLGGATQISQLGYVVFLIPMYGAGALLVRELARRLQRNLAAR